MEQYIPGPSSVVLTLGPLAVLVLVPVRDDPDRLLRFVVGRELQRARDGFPEFTSRAAEFQRLSLQEEKVATGRTEVERDRVRRSGELSQCGEEGWI